MDEQLNLYIYSAATGLTDNWHSGGAISIIARNEVDALKFMPKQAKCPKLDTILPLAGEQTQGIVGIYPDSGCC